MTVPKEIEREVSVLLKMVAQGKLAEFTVIQTQAGVLIKRTTKNTYPIDSLAKRT